MCTPVMASCVYAWLTCGANMPRTYRKTIFTNIYEDDSGYDIIVTRKGRTNPPARYQKPQTLGFLKTERERLIDDLEARAARFAPGTLRGDVDAYLKTLPKGRMKQVRAAELQAWVTAWGDWQRSKITAQIVRGQLAQWQTEGLAPSTLNHRRQALRSLYKTLDGPDAPTPVDHVKKAVERREIRAIPPVVVAAILRRVQPNISGARLKVLARTGLPPAQIGRLQPSDVDLVRRTVHVTPRRKGAGTTARTIPLTYAAVRAFKLMARYGAWGAISGSSLHGAFTRAVVKAKQHWPKDRPWPAPANLRPYDLRHAFLTEVYRRTRDLRATAELALHADMSMTARYAEAAVSATAAAARDAMDHRGTSKKQAEISPSKRLRS